MPEFVGRLSFKHFKEEEDLETFTAGLCLQFCSEVNPEDPCFVFEVGDCGEPHAHFYFKTAKSEGTIRRLLQKHFTLPPRVRVNRAQCRVKTDKETADRPFLCAP